MTLLNSIGGHDLYELGNTLPNININKLVLLSAKEIKRRRKMKSSTKILLRKLHYQNANDPWSHV